MYKELSKIKYKKNNSIKKCTSNMNGYLIIGYMNCTLSIGFPDTSVGKESTYNVGDPSSIPESGRSTGEGIGYPPLQYSWVSLVAQLVKNPPAMQETWFLSLGWEDPLENGTATDSSVLA